MDYHGSLIVDPGWRIGIAAGRFNAAIVEDLVTGVQDCYVRHGLPSENIDVARCPGAFELAGVCQQMLKTGRYQAILAVGCVIRGDTPHFDQVVTAATKGIADLAANADVPVMFGVLTTDTVDQARDRAGVTLGNKGFEAALAAIELANLYHGLRQDPA